MARRKKGWTDPNDWYVPPTPEWLMPTIERCSDEGRPIALAPERIESYISCVVYLVHGVFYGDAVDRVGFHAMLYSLVYDTPEKIENADIEPLDKFSDRFPMPGEWPIEQALEYAKYWSLYGPGRPLHPIYKMVWMKETDEPDCEDDERELDEWDDEFIERYETEQSSLELRLLYEDW